VGHERNLGALLDEVLDGRERGADARVVGDLAAVERDIEIDPDKNALALDVDVLN
jgi:hypothetical protein